MTTTTAVCTGTTTSRTSQIFTATGPNSADADFLYPLWCTGKTESSSSEFALQTR